MGPGYECQRDARRVATLGCKFRILVSLMVLQAEKASIFSRPSGTRLMLHLKKIEIYVLKWHLWGSKKLERANPRLVLIQNFHRISSFVSYGYHPGLNNGFNSNTMVTLGRLMVVNSQI